MNTEEINRYIHEEIMGKCVHANRRTFINPGPVFTERCTDCDRLATVPDYCSDDSPRRLLNEVVLHVTATVRGWNLFVCKLVAQLNAVQHPSMATAEQIARACVEAHKEEE